MRLSWTAAWVLCLGLASSCSGRRERPALPAPEYERHDVAPWDAGKTVDPLDDDAGDWLDYEDDEPSTPSAPAPIDAGTPDAAPSGDAGGDASKDAGGGP